MAIKFTKQQKEMLVAGLLPLLADFMEDISYRQKEKNLVNQLIAEIRKKDQLIMNYGTIEVHAASVDIQSSVREFIWKSLNPENL